MHCPTLRLLYMSVTDKSNATNEMYVKWPWNVSKYQGLGQLLELQIELKVKVRSLVSSAKCYSLDFTLLPPGPWTCPFISCLNSLASMQPGCHFQCTELFKCTSLHCPTRYPLTPGSRECTCGQCVLPRSKTSEHNSAQPGIEPAIFHL